MLILCSGVAIVTTVGIVLSVLFESTRFFGEIPPSEFLFGTKWSPQTAIRADQVGSSGSFGAIPLFVGTLLISAIAMFIAVPVGIDVGHLFVGICNPEISRVCQTHAGNSGGCSHRRLRVFRAL